MSVGTPQAFQDSVAAPSSAHAGARWQSFVEFLAVGGITLVLLPLSYALRRYAGLDEAEFLASAVAFHAAFVINDPHFSVTYLLFYANAKERAFGSAYGTVQKARYWLAGFIVPLGLAALAAVAFWQRNAAQLGVMVQAMYFLVGWHYVKQGFGVFVVLSARRRITFSKRERTTLLAHCFAGWLYSFACPADPGRELVEKGVWYTTWAHPPGLEPVTAVAFGVSTLAVAGVFLRRWRHGNPLPPWAPLVGLLAPIWLWRVFSTFDTALWYLIPTLHSLQYLYFVTLLKRNEARARVTPSDFRDSVARRLTLLAVSALALGWLLFRIGPQWLDATFVLRDADDPYFRGLGATPYLAAAVTFVNIHHYFMDSVIWRREHPPTKHLFE